MMLAKTLFALTLLAAANAECPNACSGHGACGQYDMCTCMRNWKSNDCSERVCPFGFSFVTTPQGDLNMDGDRYDNSHKLLVKTTGGSANVGTMMENDDVLTLAVTIQTGELTVGDALRISDETFVVTAANANNKEFTVDHDRFTPISTADNVYRFLETQASPKGTWESWVGDYGEDDEGHYYMECSNRGVCDGKEGVCECFAGYTGNACQRQACPNDCSGHGTCETITELAQQNSTELGTTIFSASRDTNLVMIEDRVGFLTGQVQASGLAAGVLTLVGLSTAFQAELVVGDKISLDGEYYNDGTIYTVSAIASGTSLTISAPSTGLAAAVVAGTVVRFKLENDYIAVGDILTFGSRDGTAHLVTATSADVANGVLVTPHPEQTFPFGAKIYRQPAYEKWDADKNRACLCDYSFTGADCSARDCPHGDDPLTVDTTPVDSVLGGTNKFVQRNEKQNIYLDTMRGSLSGSFTLTFTDAFGQKWTTGAIDVNGRLSSKAYVYSSADTASVALTGTVVVTLGATLWTGTSTLFTTELKVGDTVTMFGSTFTVDVIVSATVMYVKEPLIGPLAASGATAYHTWGKASTYNMVSFSPALPYGELSVGDFLMIGDERHEVTSTSPSAASGLYRPIKLGGVVDLVKVRNTFNVASSGVRAFRAGPAKGIKDALEALPNGVVQSVTTENFNTGTLVGHHTGGASTDAQGVTAIYNVLGNHDQNGATTYGTSIAPDDDTIAPYDQVRIVAANGFSEFVQLKESGISPAGFQQHFLAKGAITSQSSDLIQNAATGSTSVASKTLGIGAGKIGAIYKAGGYHVRVTFNSNAGDLPDMEVDTSGTYSVFHREFTATVTAAAPTKVKVLNHGSSAPVNATLQYPYPVMCKSLGLGEINEGCADSTMYKGDVADLKVLAGMKIKLADQVRTVTQSIATGYSQFASDRNAYFTVDAPYVANDASETVDNVAYIFYKYHVEQLYDDATYNALTLSRTGFLGASTITPAAAASTTNANNQNVMTISADIAGHEAGWGWQWHNLDGVTTGMTQSNSLKPLFGNFLVSGAQFTVSKCSNALQTSLYIDGSYTANGFNSGGVTAVRVAKHGKTGTNKVSVVTGRLGEGGGTALAVPSAQLCQLRIYEKLSTFDIAVHKQHQKTWALVTDQRPLVWNSPTTSLSALSTVLPSPSHIEQGSIVGAGSGAATFLFDGTQFAFATSNTGTTWTFSGTGVTATAGDVNLLDYFGFDGSVTQTFFIKPSGCGKAKDDTDMSAINAEVYCSATGAAGATQALTVAHIATYGVSAVPFAADNAQGCHQEVVTFTSRMGSLIDSKAIAIGDRVKVRRTIGDYETRSVDKIWGAGNDVTQFSVEDTFGVTGPSGNGNSDMQTYDKYAWVDESGTTEDATCSNRGLCDGDSGVCECFGGYTSNNCGTQDALKQ